VQRKPCPKQFNYTPLHESPSGNKDILHNKFTLNFKAVLYVDKHGTYQHTDAERTFGLHIKHCQ
jgi:hypothetical protein